MTPDAIRAYLLEAFPGVETTSAHGYDFFFQGADRMMPFVTLALNGNEHEQVSRLDRPGAFRLNVGVGHATYRSMFGQQPKPPEPGGVVATGHDFAALDVIVPHPHYAYTSWIAVVSPSAPTFERLAPLIAEAHALAVRREAGR